MKRWCAACTLLIAVVLTAGGLGAQVYVGGVQTQIGSAGNPWSGPVGVASDPSGNLYVSEYSGTIFKIDATTHATSTALTSACGEPFAGIQDLAADANDNLYIADQQNQRIVKYNLATATCTATYSVNGPFGVALDSSGNIWVTTDNGSSSKVSRIAANAVSGTSATAYVTSGLSSANGVTFDASGNMYISDQTANTIWKYVSPYGNSNQSAFLTSSNGSSKPYGAAFDSSGNLYVAEAGSNQVLKYLASSNFSTYIQITPNITYAEGVALDPNGNIFVTAYQGSTVTEISPSVGSFGQVNLGSSNTLAVNFDVVSGTTVGSFKVVDRGATGLEFREPSPDTNANLCVTGSAYASTSACSINVVFTPSTAGQQMGAVQALSTSGAVLATAYVSGTGLAPLVGFSPGVTSTVSPVGLNTALSGPRRPAIDSAGNLYIADLNNNRVLKIAPSGTATVISTGSYSLNAPNGVAIDGAGNLYIDNSTSIIEVDPLGNASQLSTNSLSSSMVGVAVDAAGNVYAPDTVGNRILKFPASGGGAAVMSISGVTFSNPRDVAVDGSGDLYVTDENNNRVVKVVSGVGTVVNLGSVTLSTPAALGLDAAGNLYISDTGHNRVVQVLAAGGATVLNTGTYVLTSPVGVAAGASGQLYILDAGNNRILSLAQSTPSPFSYQNTEVGSVSGDSPKTETLLNLGNQPLTIASAAYATSVPSGGTSFASDSTTTCTSTLAAGSACVYGMDFTPAAAGTNTGTLTLTDNAMLAANATQVISLSGMGEQITVTPATLAQGVFGAAFSATLSSTGGTAPYTYSLVTGSLPAGLTLTNGVIAGTPTAVGTYTFTVQASDSSPAPGPFTGTVNESLVVNKATSTLTGPTQPVTVTTGQATTVPVSITGQYAGTGIATPSGSIAYGVTNSAGATVGSGSLTIANGTVTIPVAATLAPGTYTVTASYGGDGNYSAAASITTQVVVAPIQPTVQVTVSPSISYGGTLGSAVTATATSGSATVAGTFHYSVNGVAVSSSTVLPAGSYTVTVTFTPADSTTYKTVSVSQSVVIAKATASESLVTSVNPVFVTNAVTFTATMGASATTPTGTVTFLDGTTSLGQSAMVNGVAALTVKTLVVGSHAITAMYSGDTNYTGVTSAVLTETVNDFSFTVGAPSQTILPGATATYSVTVTPLGAATLPAQISLALTGLPAGATSTIAPQSIAAGAAATAVSVTVTVPQQTAAAAPAGRPWERTPASLALLLLPMAGWVRRKKMPGRWLTALLFCLATAGVLGLGGCGANNGFLAQPQQSYTLSLTGTSGALTHTANMTLTVQ